MKCSGFRKPLARFFTLSIFELMPRADDVFAVG